MPAKNISQPLSKDIQILFTEKPVTAWGGMSLIARFFKSIGLAKIFNDSLPNEKTSNNSIPPAEICLSFLVSVLKGASRFAHVSSLRQDKALLEMFGFTRPPSDTSVRRYFNSLRRVHIEEMWSGLNRFALSLMPAPARGHVIDLDSTVIVRYGDQQGSAKGYNPKKPGRLTHHPLLAFLSETKTILHVWLRSGNCSSSRGAVEFLKEAAAFLPKYAKFYALRADSGFFQRDFLDELESMQLLYAVAARFNSRVKRIAGYQVKNWKNLSGGIEIGETVYQAFGWDKERRLIVIREKIAERKKASGRKLIDLPAYTFHAIITNMTWAPEDVWRFYNGRADCENRIKELCGHYNANAFCLRSFDGTEAALRLTVFLFNLMAAFKLHVLKNSAPMLEKVRNKWLTIGASLISHAGKFILKLAVNKSRIGEFQTLFARVASPFQLPRNSIDST